MIEKPYIGQKCRLNDDGMRHIGGITSTSDFRDSQELTIRGVSEVMCYNFGKPVYCLDLEPESIGRFMISNMHVDAK